MLPERVLRLLDSLDGMAYAARLACTGYWGHRLRVGVFAVVLWISLAVWHLIPHTPS